MPANFGTKTKVCSFLIDRFKHLKLKYKFVVSFVEPETCMIDSWAQGYVQSVFIPEKKTEEEK